jgi:hypothetical protein
MAACGSGPTARDVARLAVLKHDPVLRYAPPGGRLTASGADPGHQIADETTGATVSRWWTVPVVPGDSGIVARYLSWIQDAGWVVRPSDVDCFGSFETISAVKPHGDWVANLTLTQTLNTGNYAPTTRNQVRLELRAPSRIEQSSHVPPPGPRTVTGSTCLAHATPAS